MHKLIKVHLSRFYKWSKLGKLKKKKNEIGEKYKNKSAMQSFCDSVSNICLYGWKYNLFWTVGIVFEKYLMERVECE